MGSWSRGTRSATGVLGAALLVVVGAGCGELGAGFRGTEPVRPKRVSAMEIRRQPAHSPARALLTWCEAAQQHDGVRMRRMYDPRTAPRASREDVSASMGVIEKVGCPRVRETNIDGDSAVVFCDLVVVRVAPNGRRDSAATPIAFNLTRARDSWSMVPGSFLSLGPTSPEPGQRASPQRLVTEADLRRWAAGSPERAALELVQMIQYSDAVAALARLTPEWRLNLDGARVHVRNIAGLVRRWRLPRITSSSTSGNVATIEALLAGRTAHVELHRRAGRWQLARFRAYGLDLP